MCVCARSLNNKGLPVVRVKVGYRVSRFIAAKTNAAARRVAKTAQREANDIAGARAYCVRSHGSSGGRATINARARSTITRR